MSHSLHTVCLRICQRLWSRYQRLPKRLQKVRSSVGISNNVCACSHNVWLATLRHWSEDCSDWQGNPFLSSWSGLYPPTIWDCCWAPPIWPPAPHTQTQTETGENQMCFQDRFLSEMTNGKTKISCFFCSKSSLGWKRRSPIWTWSTRVCPVYWLFSNEKLFICYEPNGKTASKIYAECREMIMCRDGRLWKRIFFWMGDRKIRSSLPKTCSLEQLRLSFQI